MQEMSLNALRAEHEERIGVAMREVLDAKVLGEEFGKIIDRLRTVDPASPLAGYAQHEVITFCEQAQSTCRQNADHRQTVVDRLKAECP